MLPRMCAALIAVAIALLCPRARADDELHLAVSSNVRGAIAALACQREASPPLLHGLDPIFHAAVAEGDLVVDAGHFLGASFLGNEALRRKPALLADLVEHLGIRAMALEHRDLIVPRPLLVSFAEALAAYEQAYELEPLPALLFNRGRALQLLDRLPEALEAFERFKRDAPPDLLAKVPKLEQLIGDVRAQVGTIEVVTKVVGAEVVIGGRTVGMTTLALAVRL